MSTLVLPLQISGQFFRNSITNTKILCYLSLQSLRYTCTLIGAGTQFLRTWCELPISSGLFAKDTSGFDNIVGWQRESDWNYSFFLGKLITPRPTQWLHCNGIRIDSIMLGLTNQMKVLLRIKGANLWLIQSYPQNLGLCSVIKILWGGVSGG